MSIWIEFTIAAIVAAVVLGFIIWNTTNDFSGFIAAVVIGFVLAGFLQIGTYHESQHKQAEQRKLERKQHIYDLYKERYGITVKEIHINWDSSDVIIFTRKGVLCSAEAGGPQLDGATDAKNIILNLQTLNCENSASIDAKIWGKDG